MKGPPAGFLPEGSPLQEATRPVWRPLAPGNAEGLLAACAVVISSALIPKLLVQPSSPSEDLIRASLPGWAVISVIALACRRRLAPLLGLGRLEAWAAAFAGVFVTVAAGEFYYFRLLRGVPLAPARTVGLAELALYCLAIGLFEELGFRGVVLEGFAGVFSRPVAHALTILSFAFVHFRPLIGWPSLLLFGLLFGLLREYGRSLWPCAASHALIDFLIVSRWVP